LVKPIPDDEEPTMTWLTVNILLMVLFFALWVGIPVWLVLRRTEANREAVAATAVAYLPARRHEGPDQRHVA
jgi:hypothetical protein